MRRPAIWSSLLLPLLLFLATSRVETTEKIQAPGTFGSIIGDSCLPEAEITTGPCAGADAVRECWTLALAPINARVERDLDVFVDAEFVPQDSTNENEMFELATAMDNVFANRRGAAAYDLQMIYDYFGLDPVPYGEGHAPDWFSVFRGEPAKLDHHVDLYISWFTTCYWCKFGTYPSRICDEDDEDPPGQTQSHDNSLSLPTRTSTLSLGEETGMPAGGIHEFAHLLADSRGDRDGRSFNEMIATFAEYLIYTGGAAYPYHEFYDFSLLLWNAHMDTTECAGWESGKYAYGLWSLWGAWLFERFKGAQPADDLVYRWLREKDPEGDPADSTFTSFYTLAQELGDSFWDSTPGFSGLSGQERLQLLYRRHAVARWMDPDPQSQWGQTHAFPENIDPYSYLNLFTAPPQRKRAPWEPPTFVVDASSLCTTKMVPDPTNAEDRRRWIIRAPDGSCDYAATPIWGSSYYVFEAGSGVDGQSGLTLDVNIEVTQHEPGGNDWAYVDWITYDDKGALYTKPDAVIATGAATSHAGGNGGRFTIEGFGPTVKSAVAVVSVVENPVSRRSEAWPTAFGDRTHTRHEVAWKLTTGECTTRARVTSPQNLLVCPGGDAGAIDVVLDVYENGEPVVGLPACRRPRESAGI